MPPLPDRADPAVLRAEGLREPVRDLGVVLDPLTGQHPHPHPIHRPRATGPRAAAARSRCGAVRPAGRRCPSRSPTAAGTRTPARHHDRTRSRTCASNVTGHRTRHTTSPATRPPRTPSGRAGMHVVPAQQAAVASVIVAIADGVRMIQTSSRTSCRASHSASTSHSETRMTSGRKNAGGSSRYVDRPITTTPVPPPGRRVRRSQRPAPRTRRRITAGRRGRHASTNEASSTRRSCDGPPRSWPAAGAAGHR